ncbi:MAG: rRNA cytosine-C5-methyltransferase [Bacteroidales bacterium]|nr:rRNA cytosine-C5-methyltransferase [Bacteroidales bacterium]
MALFPQEFIDSTRAVFGDRAEVVLEALSAGDSVTAVRANPAKISASTLRGRFAAAGEFVPWCGDAFYLDERPVFSLDPMLHAGAYYVQDPSAMFVGAVAKMVFSEFEDPLKVLDLCAAPGGKSTAVAASLRPSDLLVSNEVIGSRASILAENMVKWGTGNAIVTNNDPKDFARLAETFDIILADVPCSGEGMFRKDAGAVAEWSLENVRLCAARQRRIVADVWDSLREGGYLIYSTCTFNSSENDDNVKWICRELGADVELLTGALASSGAMETKYGLQFAPGITRGEGQYVALLRKTAPAKTGKQSKPFTVKRASTMGSKSAKSIKCDWVLTGMTCYEVETSAGKMLKAYPSNLESEIRSHESRLKVIRSGVAVASVKGRDLVPQADLALSQAFNSETFPQVELTREQALQFLRCEAIQLPDAPKGFLTVTYEQLPIGFVKNLGSRANNLFPQSWRLRIS